MSRCRHALRPSGYTLLEMMVVVVLMATFVVVAAAGYRMVFSQIRQASLSNNQSHQLQSVIDQLERDVWTASEIVPVSPYVVRLVHPSGKIVSWGIRVPQGIVIRLAGHPGGVVDQTQWQIDPTGLTFSVDGPLLMLQQTPTLNRESAQRCFASQLLLLREGPR